MSWSAEAHKLVVSDRNADYGPPREDFEATAKIWSGLLSRKLKTDITYSDVALMMVALKLRRETFKHKPDNIVDAHGYLDCLEWCVTGRKPEA
jgi:hypothetical protein